MSLLGVPCLLHEAHGAQIQRDPFKAEFKKSKKANWLPRRLSAHETACQRRSHRRCKFDSWVGKIPQEKEMATHSSILALRLPRTEETGVLQSMESKRVGHN